MYRVFRNIISQVIWARKFEEREGWKREKRKNINKVMPRVQERDRE